MKKILFITMSLGLGGSEKCMSEMIRQMDLDEYDITLLCLIKSENYHMFDKRIKIINGYEGFDEMYMPIKEYCRTTSSKRYLSKLISKIRFSLKTKLYKNKVHLSRFFWEELSKYILPYNEKYDTVIGYGQGICTYFTIDKVTNCSKKILWLNTDLVKAKYPIEYIRRFYTSADYVVSDSKNGNTSLLNLFPKLQDKVIFFPNIINVEDIKNKAEEYSPELKSHNSPVILTVGRLCEAKALHLAVSAAKILKERKIDFKWYIVGEGNLRAGLETQINELDVKDYITLVGAKPNPYPWFKMCDIYVQTSVYEGSCMTINEAMVFSKPIVSTNFPAAFEKITDGVNGLICKMSAEDIADKVSTLLNDEKCKTKLKEYLINNPVSYGEQMKTLYAIL